MPAQKIRHVFHAAIALAFAAIAFPSPAQAGGFGAWGGSVDTETFGEGFGAGAQVEIGILPCFSLLVRGGYESGFDDVRLGEAGFTPGNNARRSFASAGVDPARAMMEDFAVAPVEAGALLRLPPLFGVVGVYGGAGAGWYYMPGFDVTYNGRSVSTDAVTDLVGWWALAGVDVGMSFFHVFAEAKYVSASKEGETFNLDWISGSGGAVRGDVDLTGLSIIGGVRFDW